MYKNGIFTHVCNVTVTQMKNYNLIGHNCTTGGTNYVKQKLSSSSASTPLWKTILLDATLTSQQTLIEWKYSNNILQNGGSMRSLEVSGAKSESSSKTKFFIKSEKLNKKRWGKYYSIWFMKYTGKKNKYKVNKFKIVKPKNIKYWKPQILSILTVFGILLLS